MMAVEETGSLLKDPEIHDDIISHCIDRSSHSQSWIICFCLALGNAMDAIEIMCVGYIITEIGDISVSSQEFLTSAVFLGMLVGGLTGGYLSDAIGRRPTLLLSLSLNAVAGLVSAVAPTVSLLIFIRVISGLGIGGSVPIVFSLGSEVFPTKTRGKMLSVVASFWMVGAILVALFAWLILGTDVNGERIYADGTWRIFAAVSAVPVFCTLALMYFYVPESPRFLVNKSRFSEASAALLALCNVAVDESTLAAAYPHSLSEPVIAPLYSSSFNIRGWMKLLTDSSLGHLFQPSLIKNTIVLGVICYGLSTWITKLFINIGLANPFADAFIFAIANLPGNIFSILYIESLGRRKLLSYGMLLAAASSLLFAVDVNSQVVVVLAAAMFNAFSVTGWNSLDCMSVEYYPSAVRASAMGVLASAGRIGSISAQFVNGSLQSNVPLLLFVTTGCMAVGGLLTWWLPDDSVKSEYMSVVTISDLEDTPKANTSKKSISNPLIQS